MNKQLIAEIIKMPYEAKDDIFIVDGNDTPVLSIEYLGKRRFQPSENDRTGYEYNLDAEAFLKFTAAAINEKVRRDLYEPLRWIYRPPKENEIDTGNYFECPSCVSRQANKSNYCPCCGRKLLPPIPVESEYIVSETIDGVQTGLIISKESIEE